MNVEQQLISKRLSSNVLLKEQAMNLCDIEKKWIWCYTYRL